MAGNKPGRPGWELTDEHRQTIVEAAAKGVTEADIARLVGLAPTTFSEKKKQFPELDELIRTAKAKHHNMAAGLLYNIWSNPNHPKHLQALIFYLKTQHGWKDNNDTIEVKPLPGVLQFTKVTKLEDKEEE